MRFVAGSPLTSQLGRALAVVKVENAVVVLGHIHALCVDRRSSAHADHTDESGETDSLATPVLVLHRPSAKRAARKLQGAGAREKRLR